jgi:hypothetical protein
MALETSTYINGLVATNPTSTDNVGDGDNHIRLLKSTIKATFPNISGALTASHTAIDGSVSTVNAATNANTASTLVKRDGSGNFSAGTITAALTGNVTGNVTGDVTGNVTGNLTGDVTGNVTGNVTGSSGSSTGNAATASKWANARTITLSGDATGSVSIDGSANRTLSVSIDDDSHNHIIGNVDGLQTALNGKLGSTSTAANSTKWGNYNVSTSATGADSNTIYFRT